MEVFWPALTGALVGGLASTFGALIVAKRTQTRTYRARILDELLPALTDLLKSARPDSLSSKYRAAAADIRSAAHVIGGKDATKASGMYDRLVTWQSLLSVNLTRDGAGGSYVSFESEEEQERAERAYLAFQESIEHYEEWLKDRLSRVI